MPKLPHLATALSFCAALAIWQAAVWIARVPAYLVPGPLRIISAFLADPSGLLHALAATLAVTVVALVGACLVGVLLAGAMAAHPWLRAAIEPWAVAAQMTPIVAVAPLIIVWVGDPFAAMAVCAVGSRSFRCSPIPRQG